jgi:hypothetical protein
MTNPIAINLALDQIAELDGQPVELEGILQQQSDGYYLTHYPSADRRSEYTSGNRDYPPAIVLAFGSGSVRPNQSTLSRWIGRRVRVHGVIRSTLLPHEDNTDYFGLIAPASIEPYSVQRLTAEERREMAPNTSLERTRER